MQEPEATAGPAPLQTTLARQGQWLFRWRSYLPLPLLAALMAWSYRYPPTDLSSSFERAWEVGCVAVGMAGFALRVWTAGVVPRGTSGRNTGGQVAYELNTSGPYSLVRHPLYDGNFLMWLAAALFTRSLPLVLVSAAYFWFCYERIMITEERFLVDRFGDDYRHWASRTPALIPGRSRWKPSALPFSWRTAARREYPGLFGLVLVLLALHLAQEAGGTGLLHIGPWWGVLLILASICYILCRTLKRKTDVLQVSGR